MNPRPVRYPAVGTHRFRPMKPDDCIFFRLAKANQTAGRFWKKQLTPFKLTAVQGLVLAFLNAQDGLTPAQLGKRVRLDSATMTGVLTRLEKLGLVTRCQDREDRRSVRIHLTAQGRQTGRRVASTLAVAHDTFMAPFSPEEADLLGALLQRIET